jgi:DNA-binding PadR family transcriptional regulator
MITTSDTVAEHLPLKAVHHLVLLLLAEKPTYGVDLLERLEERSGGTVRLNAGSLYRTLAGLVDDGLVEPREEVASPGGPGAPRKIYGLTALGRAVLAAEAERQRALLEMARSLELLEEG